MDANPAASTGICIQVEVRGCDAQCPRCIAAVSELLGEQVRVATTSRCQVRVVPAADEAEAGVFGTWMTDDIEPQSGWEAPTAVHRDASWPTGRHFVG